VREIVGAIDMTPVPLANRVVKGLINLRGQIVTTIDLRACFRFGDAPETQPSVNVIVNIGDGLSSLLVDRVGEIIEVDSKSFSDRPETLQGVARDLIRGAYKLENELMHVLDLERTLQLAG
jgi:purine-binding chemotaxis protein CheW